MKILIVANSRKTKGGVTSVLKQWEQMTFFKHTKYYWLETQINAGILSKLFYMISSYLKAIFILPAYDIVHFHTTPGNSVLVQMPIFLYSLLWRKKIVLHLHVGNQLLDHKDDKSFRYVLRKSNRVVVLANVWKQKMQEYYGVSCDVIYNPCQNVEIKVPYEEREPLIFYAAYLTKNKGYDLLIKAFSQLAHKYPQWKLVIAGAGEVNEARKMITNLGLSKRVDLLFWQNEDEMRKLYNRASIYCITSYKEGFPMAALEAWSYGIPLVTTPVGGLVDVIKHQNNVMVFDFGDVEQLMTGLDELMRNETLRKRISTQSLELVDSKFSLGKVEKDLENFYFSIR